MSRRPKKKGPKIIWAVTSAEFKKISTENAGIWTNRFENNTEKYIRGDIAEYAINTLQRIVEEPKDSISDKKCLVSILEMAKLALKMLEEE